MLSMIDLFSGAGGLSFGLQRAGFHSLYANELQGQYAQTYALNNPTTLVDSQDIRNVDAKEIRRVLGIARGQLDLVAGGPPCQGFSINAPARSSDDKRNHLFKEFLRFVEEFQPRATLIENVPGLVSFENGQTLSAILAALDLLGYDASVRILYAPHFGVPQTRSRTIIVGVRKSSGIVFNFPEATHDAPFRVNFTQTFQGKSLLHPIRNQATKPHTTVKDALSDLPLLLNGEVGPSIKDYRSAAQNAYQALLRSESTGVQNHEAPRLGSINLARLSHIPAGGNWTDIPFELLPPGMQRARRSDHTKRYGRTHPDGLASTILTKCDPHWGAYFHYAQDRVFSVREAARLQSFPDKYVFTGSRSQQYEQVGNAVPPLLGAAVGQAIAGSLVASITQESSLAS